MAVGPADAALATERHKLMITQMELIAETYVVLGEQIHVMHRLIDAFSGVDPSEKWDNRREQTLRELFNLPKELKP